MTLAGLAGGRARPAVRARQGGYFAPLGAILGCVGAIVLGVLAMRGDHRGSDPAAAPRALLEQGDYDGAAARARDCLASRSVEDQVAADLLDVLAEALRRAEPSGAAAESVVLRAIDLKRRLARPAADIARSVFNHGALLLVRNAHGEARARLAEAAALWPATDPESALPHIFLAKLEVDERHLDAAAAHFARAAERQRSLDPATALDVAMRLHCEAELAQCRGDLAAAEAKVHRAIDIRARRLRTGHPHLLASLHNLMIYRLDRADLVGALEVQERVLEQRAATAARAPARYAHALHTAAVLAAQVGRPEEAYARTEQALELYSGKRAGDPRAVASCRLMLARLATEQGRVQVAAEHLRAAEADLGGGVAAPVERALCRQLKAYLRWRSGDAAGALRDYEALLRDLQAQPDSAIDALLDLWSPVGRIRAQLGDGAGAEDAFAAALRLAAQVYGPEHPSTAAAHLERARLWLDQGRTEAAMAEALVAESIGREHLLATATSAAETFGLDYAGARTRGLDLALAMADRTVAAAPRVFDALVRSRAPVLDVQRELREVALQHPELGDAWRAVRDARQTLARALVDQDARAELPEPGPEFTAARHALDLAERRLIERSETFRAARATTRAGGEEVIDALPAGTVLLSFVRFAHARAGDLRRGPEGYAEASYGVFVVRHGALPQWVYLAAAAGIDHAVAAWHRALHGSDAELRARGLQLRRALWDPIAARVANAELILVVPDGELHRINLAALPADDDRWLIEVAPPLHLLAAERDVVRLRAPQAPSASNRLLAVGDPDPDLGVAAGRAVRSFGALPAAGREAAQVARFWQESLDGVATVLGRQDATEAAVKAALPGCTVLHLAMHGFFHGSSPAGDGARGRDADGNGPPPAPSAPPLRSALRAGLVLAGGNGLPPLDRSLEDGILTVDEVLALDLRGTHWAVLSACDTGRGDLRVDEGVVGMRRAFLLAGARTVISSLWPVDDRATHDWMLALYALHFRERLATARAVQQASLAWLRAQRAARDSTHPRLWAPFVAIGDWR